ncbi:MAG: glycoside hydrolase family 15 protein [Bdellovibrionales bacterium]|nr:glycoside hydrolase family 15 protein [Bdellovibrionales bacterium]
MHKFLFLFLAFNIGSAAFADVDAVGDHFEDWLNYERQFAESRILDNISPQRARRGAVIASPSKHNPNYYYHWVRDGALVMDIWMRRLEGYPSRLSNANLEALMWDFVHFTEYGQHIPALSGLGEPRYDVDGFPNQEPWGRPQNDGPALRASLLIRFAYYLIGNGQIEVVKSKLWPVIMNDLYYTGDQVSVPSFDLWEEIKGDHFYTRVACREALLLGSDLAAALGDYGRSGWYSTQAQIAQSLALDHVNVQRQQIIENTNRVDGIWYKDSGLDVASLLALLHTTRKPILNLNDQVVMSTINKIEQSFNSIYPINRRFSDLGASIGRYPEDTYYNGNPWFLATFAFAEYYYRLGDRAKGDGYMKRGAFHAHRKGHMSEQMDKQSGYMLSAEDLTWSYAAFLTALEARQKYTSNKR